MRMRSSNNNNEFSFQVRYFLCCGAGRVKRDQVWIVMTTNPPRQELILHLRDYWKKKTDINHSSYSKNKDSSAASRISSSSSSSDNSAMEHPSPTMDTDSNITTPFTLVAAGNGRLNQCSQSESDEEKESSNFSLSPDSVVEGLVSEYSVRSISIDDDDSAWSLHSSRKRTPSKGTAAPRRKRRRRIGDGPPRHLRDPDCPSTDEVKARILIPSQRTYQHEIWRRLQTSNTIFSSKSMNSINPDDTSLCFLYRWLRVRFAAGLTRSSISLLHNMLTKSYEKARHLLERALDGDNNSDLDKLLKLRQRLAGLWCIYAHVILDLGHDALLQSSESLDAISSISGSFLVSEDDSSRINLAGTTSTTTSTPSSPVFSPPPSPPTAKRGRGRGRPKKSGFLKRKEISPRRGRVLKVKYHDKTPATTQDVHNHALAILSVARACPLVRNHSLIALSMGRLIVSGNALKTSNGTMTDQELSGESMYSSISSAISACWDSMDVCHNKQDTQQRFQIGPPPSKSISLISQFHSNNRPVLKEQRISEEEVETSMESVLTLPAKIRGALDFSNTVFCDRNSIRSLCVELNRLSRLGKQIQTKSEVRLSASNGDTLLDHLPFFAAYDCDRSKEKQSPNSKCMDVEDIERGYFSRHKHPRKCVIWKWQCR